MIANRKNFSHPYFEFWNLKFNVEIFENVALHVVRIHHVADPDNGEWAMMMPLL